MAETEAVSEGVKVGRTPPYISFKSLLTLIEELKTNGLPPQIDRSVLRRFSGGLGAQLVMAMKSLGLVSEDNKPTGLGAQVVRAFGTDEFPAVLRPVIEQTYPFLRELDLTEATPSMFAAAFKSGTGAKEDVLRKCRTFYIHAAQYVGIPIGTRILNGTVPRGSGGSGSQKRKPKAATGKPVGEQKPDPVVTDSNTSSLARTLLDKFPTFDPSWPDEIKAKWFDGYERLLTIGEKK